MAPLPAPLPSLPVAMPTGGVASPPSTLPLPIVVGPALASLPPPPPPPVSAPNGSQPLATAVPIISVVPAAPDPPMEASHQVQVTDSPTTSTTASLIIALGERC